MRPVALSDEIAVGEVPTPDQIVILAKAGFRSVLNAQPDGEVARFISAADAQKLAQAAGLEYAHVPIENRNPADKAIRDFSDAMAWLPRPIYACCYSGARAAAGWALALAPGKQPADLAAALEDAGYDATSLLPALERRHAGLTISGPAAAESAAAAVVSQQAITSEAALASKPIIILPRAATDGGFAVAG